MCNQIINEASATVNGWHKLEASFMDKHATDNFCGQCHGNNFRPYTNTDNYTYCADCGAEFDLLKCDWCNSKVETVAFHQPNDNVTACVDCYSNESEVA